MVEIYPQENLCDGDNEDEIDNESSDNESCDEISFLDSSKPLKKHSFQFCLDCIWQIVKWQ